MDRKSVVILLVFLALLFLPHTSALTLTNGSISYTLTGELSTTLSMDITASFINANGTTIDRITIANNTTSVTVPSGTVYLVLQADQISAMRQIYLPALSNGTTISFPFSSSVTMRSVQVMVYNKDNYDDLIITTTGGAVVAAYHLSDFTEITFQGIVGSLYVFKLVKNGQVVYTQTSGISDNTDYVALLPSQGPITLNISTLSVTITATYTDEYHRIRGFLSANRNVSGSLKVELYTYDGTYISTLGPQNFSNVASTDFTFYTPKNLSTPFVAKIIATIDGTNYVQQITCTSGRVLPDQIAPNGLMIILLSAISLFAITRANIEVSVFLMALTLTVGQMFRLVIVPQEALLFFYAMAASMFIFGRVRR